MHSSENDVGSISRYFLRAKNGDRAACSELIGRLRPIVRTATRAKLMNYAARTADGSDFVNSAFWAFCQRIDAPDGRFVPDLHREDLVAFLVRVTMNKAGQHVRMETAKKRGGGNVVTDTDLSARHEHRGLDDLPAHVADPLLDAACREILAKLDDDLLEVVTLRLMGYTHCEIASLLECSERTVERKMRVVRKRWHDDFS